MKKENLLNGNPVTPREQYGLVNLVLFTPDDLQLVKGDPALRRKFLDMEIARSVRCIMTCWLNTTGCSSSGTGF